MPLCTVSEMEIHLRQTILDCDVALKDSAEGAWSSRMCVSSGERVSNMLEQNDASRWWKNMELHCCCHHNSSKVISACCYCTDLHLEVQILIYLNMGGISAKRKWLKIHFPYLPKTALFRSSAKWESLTFSWTRLSVQADTLKEAEFPLTKTSLMSATTSRPDPGTTCSYSVSLLCCFTLL